MTEHLKVISSQRFAQTLLSASVEGETGKAGLVISSVR
jgi:hypothetical protein